MRSSTVPRFRERREARVLWVLASVVAVAGALAASWLARDAFEGDWCQHVAWTARYGDPALFPNDPHVEFFGKAPLSTPGVRALYAIAVPALGAETSARVIGTLATIAAAVLAWALGRRLGGSAGGAIAVLFVALHTRGLSETIWGLPRSFAFPLHLLTAWALVARRPWVLGLSFVLAALLYPPAFPPALGAALLLGVVTWRSHRPPLARAVVPAIGAAVAIVLLLGAYTGVDDAFGPRVDVATAKAMPEFEPRGRAEFFDPNPIRYWMTGRYSGEGAGPKEAATALGVMALLFFKRRRWLPPLAPAFLAAGLVCFAVAHATLFHLHLPNRFSTTIWPVAEAMVLAACLPHLFPRWLLRKGAWTRSAHAGTVVAAVLLLATVARATQLAIRADRSPVDREADAMHAFLETLPRDTLVAAQPGDANRIPLRARRSVLASMETAQPYWLGYYRPEKERLVASLDACYATSWDDVDAFAERFGVSVFVTNAWRYAPGKVSRSPEPFGGIESRLRAQGGSTFVMRDPPPERVLFRRGPYTVVRVGAKGRGSALPGR